MLATGTARAESATYAFDRASITFSHLVHAPSGLAVGTADPGLHALLRTLGASMTWHPGDREVLIATSAPQVISFAVGDAHYSVGSLTAQARFAPYQSGGEVFVPFNDLMRALDIAPQGTVLERLLASVDVEGYGSQAVLIARGAGILRPRVVSDTPSRIRYEFDGVGTTLGAQRTINAGGVRTMEITSSGTSRNPSTTVTLDLEPGTRHDAPKFGSGEFEVGFGANGGAPPLVAPLAQTAAAPPAQNDTQAVAAQATFVPPPPPSDMAVQPSPSPASAATAASGTASATVDSAKVQNAPDGSQTVTIAVTGNARYDWHRLRAPDDRFWIDIIGAQLQGGPRDEAEANPLTSMRVRQIDPQTVRIALSFSGDNAVTVSPSATGITIGVAQGTVADGPREGNGSIGTIVSANEPQTAVTPVPADEYGMTTAGTGDQSYWKFGPRGYVPTNPKLIVLDPGHGGGDRGSVHGDLQEAVLTLDMAKRVQAILVARGWEVKMTRNSDHDVLATPQSQAQSEKNGYHNPDAYDLQARDDIASDLGARLFVSIHCNAYINSGPSGTTLYYYKPSDLPLAETMNHAVAQANLGTKDDGIVKFPYYVTKNADMPAVLVETAFLTNPDDYALLDSSAWRQKMAEAIAEGIDQYAQSHAVATGAQ
ncbi:MAG TPA: N-acetylmuramoyl-L-alanine amidase [Candidatus Aquilonibacter sp.]